VRAGTLTAAVAPAQAAAEATCAWHVAWTGWAWPPRLALRQLLRALQVALTLANMTMMRQTAAARRCVAAQLACSPRGRLAT
jgi:hypothetical protein